MTLKIKFKSTTLDQFIERYSVDISHGGIFIRTKDPLPVGTTLRFEFQLKDASPLITGEGTVVWTREFDATRSGVAPGMGVRFDRLPSESQGVLDRILAYKNAKLGKAAEANLAETVAGPVGGFNNVPTRVTPSALVQGLADAEARRTLMGIGPSRGEDNTPLPRPLPFHSDLDEFPDEAFEEATKVASLEALARQSAELGDGQASSYRSLEALINSRRTAPPASSPAVATATRPATGSDQASEGQERPSVQHRGAATMPAPIQEWPSSIDESSAPLETSSPEKGSPGDDDNDESDPRGDDEREPEPLFPGGAGWPPAARDSAIKTRESSSERREVTPHHLPTELSRGADARVEEQRRSADSVDILDEVIPESEREPTTDVRGLTGPTSVADDRDGSNMPWIAAAALLLLVGGIGGFMLLKGRDREATTANPGQAAPAPAPAPPTAVAPAPDAQKGGAIGVRPGQAVALTGTLRVSVTTDPPGATAELIGTTRSGPTPMVFEGLVKGTTYLVRLTRAGYTSREISVLPEDGDPAVVALVAKPALLRVTSEPTGAQVWIDGRRQQAVTPVDIALSDRAVERQQVRLSVRKNGYDSAEQEVTLAGLIDEGSTMVQEVALVLARRPVVRRPTTRASKDDGDEDKVDGSDGAGAGTDEEPKPRTGGSGADEQRGTTNPGATQKNGSGSGATRPRGGASGTGTPGAGAASSSGSGASSRSEPPEGTKPLR